MVIRDTNHSTSLSVTIPLSVRKELDALLIEWIRRSGKTHSLASLVTLVLRRGIPVTRAEMESGRLDGQ